MTTPTFIAPVEALPSLSPSLASAAAAPLTNGMGVQGSFGDLVTRGLQQVNGQLLDSQAALQTAAAGGTENMHQLMIRLEESRLSFQLMLQVRNRLLESYQELMRMQV